MSGPDDEDDEDEDEDEDEDPPETTHMGYDFYDVPERGSM